MLYADLCPGGYELTPSENGFECSCKNQVLEVLDCEEDQDRIIIEVRIKKALCIVFSSPL